MKFWEFQTSCVLSYEPKFGVWNSRMNVKESGKELWKFNYASNGHSTQFTV